LRQVSEKLQFQKRSFLSDTMGEGIKPVLLWFRTALRTHDNPCLSQALSEQLEDPQIRVFPMFVFDGESGAVKWGGFNRFQFLLECLQDLDTQFQGAMGGCGKLHLFKGEATQVFAELHRQFSAASGGKQGIHKIFFHQEAEPIWRGRDDKVKAWCASEGVECTELVGQTLYDPHEVLAANGGSPPVTFNMFMHLTECLGPPPRPAPDVDLGSINYGTLPNSVTSQQGYLKELPSPSDFGFYNENGQYSKVYVGGEREALKHFEVRMTHERRAFDEGSFLPNRRDPDILCPPKSLSPDIKFGTISVRTFYWAVMDSYEKSKEASAESATVKAPPIVVIQLYWREFFFTMSVNNLHFAQMVDNKICINIPWYQSEGNPHLQAFKEGKTGYPFIDAGVRQLKKEGWIHHILRNSLACFLTRGDLWISWEEGVAMFLHYLLDADWAVCAGNWMWVSSSAFEQVLNCSSCVDPGTYGRRSDPWGHYVKRYVPEIAKMPVEYVYEPWKAPLEVQVQAGCVVGRDYPAPIVDHREACRRNTHMMEELRLDLLRKLNDKAPTHCGPSNEQETRIFMGFDKDCEDHKNASGGGEMM